MNTEERTSYLETGAGGNLEGADRLDRIRSLLGRAETWAEPPAGLLEDILEATDREPARVMPAPRRRPRYLPGLSIAAVLAIVLVGLILFLDQGPAEQDDMVVALAGTELAPGARGEARIDETPAGWYIRLQVDGLPPAPEGSYYEGWLWREGEGVSIGTFHLRSSEPIALWSGVSPDEYPVVRITLQDVGGGPAASERVMMAGTILGD
ncbi:MAG TPA: anti-sigma factor [Acidimicrobiia bacterium]